MDNGNWTTPVALAADAPVAQTVVGNALAHVAGFNARDYVCFGFVNRHSVQEIGVDDGAFVGKRFGAYLVIRTIS